MQESQVNIVTTLIADSQPPVVVQPGEGALCHPPMPAQSLAALHSFTCYAALDPSLAKRRSTPSVVIRFVAMPLIRALAWASRLTSRAFDRFNAVYHLLEHYRIMD